MNKTLLLLALAMVTYTVKPQCSTDAFITTNYTKDAKILALREILSDPLDTYYNSPEIPISRYQPYLEQLSVIYTNAAGLGAVDALFVDYEIHANTEYPVASPYKTLGISVTTTTSWVTNLKTTGLSGDATLDNLLATYNFSVTSYVDVVNAETTHFELTSTDILNIRALEDDFLAIPGIITAESMVNLDDRFNYTGISHTLTSTWGETSEPYVSDIVYNSVSNVYTFWLYGGDCFSGCAFGESWSFQMNDSCTFTPMATDSFNLASLELYPNPTNAYITIKSQNTVSKVAIYNTNGILIKETHTTNAIDVATFAAGIYFVKITGTSGATVTKKFVKI